MECGCLYLMSKHIPVPESNSFGPALRTKQSIDPLLCKEQSSDARLVPPGDITLVAPLCIGAYLNIISNPTTKSLANFLHTAERRAWPSLVPAARICHALVTSVRY